MASTLPPDHQLGSRNKVWSWNADTNEHYDLLKCVCKRFSWQVPTFHRNTLAPALGYKQHQQSTTKTTSEKSRSDTNETSLHWSNYTPSCCLRVTCFHWKFSTWPSIELWEQKYEVYLTLTSQPGYSGWLNLTTLTWTPKMETISSGTVSMYQTIRHHNPDAHTLNNHHSQSLKTNTRTENFVSSVKVHITCYSKCTCLSVHEGNTSNRTNSKWCGKYIALFLQRYKCQTLQT
jgi:hypothetical protein